MNTKTGEFEFTDDQKNCLTFLSTSHGWVSVIGQAGVGKSTVIIEYIKICLSKGLSVVCTAPTNKATRVLSEMASCAGITVDCITTYSLLGLVLTSAGEVREIRQKGSTDSYDILIIDECSMVGEKLWTYLQKNGGNFGKIVFMGDSAQLPPVKEGLSPSFSLLNKFTLTKIVRQHADNPIISLCSSIRKSIFTGTPYVFKKELQENSKDGVYCYNGIERFEKQILRAYEKLWDKGPNEVRVLAWTNRQVDYYNSMIRKHLIGETETPFIVGEYVVTKSPVNVLKGLLAHYNILEAKVEMSPVLSTDSIAKVVGIHKTMHPFYVSLKIPVYAIELIPFTKTDLDISISDTESKNSVTAYFPADNCAKNIAIELAASAKKNPKLWEKFWLFSDSVNDDIAPCYSNTIHRSQGSTYSSVVFVNAVDINYISDPKERHRCMYVGVSRSAKKVVILGEAKS